MAKDVTVDLNVNTNIEGSIAQLKQLKKQLKETAVGTEEFKNLYNQIDDLEDKIKSAQKQSSDWVDSLEMAGGPLGTLGAAINRAKVATQTFGGALKATGIGLLVSLIGGLVAAFNNSERATKKLEPLLIGLERIFNGVFAAVEPLFDLFLDLANKALPLVSDAFAVVYATTVSVAQSLGSVGSAIVKLIKGDFSGAWQSAKSSVTDFGDNFDKTMALYEKGTNEMTKTEKENLKTKKEVTKEKKDLDAEYYDFLEQQMARELEAIAQHTKDLVALDEQYRQEIYDLEAETDQQKLDLWERRRVDEIERLGATQEEKKALLLKLEKETSLKQIAIDKAASLERIGHLNAYADAAMAVGNLLGEQTIQGKALAIAASLISTYTAIAKQLEAFAGVPIPGYAIAEAIATGAVGFAQVANIASVDVGGGASTSYTMANTPAAPRFNVVGASPMNQAAQLMNKEQAPIKTYVLSSDVTTAQALDRNKITSATLG